jgi:hypothetical protein
MTTDSPSSPTAADESTPATSDDQRPTTAEELVAKHGRETLEALAADGNLAARETLAIVDESGDSE